MNIRKKKSIYFTAILVVIISILLSIVFAAFIGLYLKATHESATKKITLFSDIIPTSISGELPEFSFQSQNNKCNVSVYDIGNHENNINNFVVDSFPVEVKENYSPWVSNVDDILYEMAYFYSIDFADCLASLESRYRNTKIDLNNLDNNHDINIKLGGMVKYAYPLSHADTAIILVKINGNVKIIFMNGEGI